MLIALEQHVDERPREGDLADGHRGPEVLRAERQRDAGGRREGAEEEGEIGAPGAHRPADSSTPTSAATSAPWPCSSRSLCAARRPPSARSPASPRSAAKSARAF